MKKYIIIICMILLSAFAAFAQTPGVTHRGEVTKEEDSGTVDRHGEVVDCPSLTQYGEIISYAAMMESLSGSLDGTVNVAVGIQITKADNADSVGFELATDADFLNIVGHISHSNVNTVLYQDTFKNLTPGETYYVRAFIANCPTSVYSNVVDVTTTGFYNLSFFSRGGSGSMSDQSFTHGVSQKINPNEFTRANADFAGWTTDAAGCGILYSDSASMTLYSADSVFAQWKTWCTGIPRSNESGTSHIDSVKDHQNNWYKVVQIGRQCWLKENLRATTSVNGTPILTTDGSIIAGKRVHPIDELGREGYLYNWSAAMDLAENTVVGTELVKHRGLCPEGWHIPVQAEWDTLFSVAKAGYLAAYNCKIPSTDYYWESSSVTDAPGNDASLDKNIYEFSSIPTGYYSNDRMMLTKSNALYHSATSTSNIVSYVASVLASSASAHTVVEDSSKLKRSAVRCIRDVSDFVTVTFNDNLGAGTETTQIVQTMTDTVLAANAFMCPNGTFIGWNTDRKGKGTHYEDEAEINLSEDLTLYAQWNRSCVGTALANEVQNDIYVDSVRDYEGNAYATIRMGSQCWMRSNLISTKYADGEAVTTGNQKLYGRYYNAAAALRKVADTTFAAPSGVQGVCPNGWHLPSIAEWQQMFAFVESNPVFVCGDETVDGILGTGVAKALASDTLWKSTTANSCYPGYALSENNATGFDIRPGGYQQVTDDGSPYSNMTTYAYFWSTTYPNPTNTAKYFNVRITNNLSYAYQDPASGSYRYTVRCVRDIPTVLGEVVVDTAACSYIDVHATLDNGSFAPSYSFSIYKDQACTQPADGFKQVTRSADKKMVSARFYDLSANTHYYIRFQYTSAFGTELDTVVSAATTCYCLAISALNEFERGAELSGQVRIDSVYDHQGHRYNVVQIGAQCWLKENMRATTSPSTNSNIVVTGNIYSYSGKIARWANTTDTINGLLYNWNAANDVYNTSYDEVSTATDNNTSHHKDTVFTSVNRGICPLGWHVPSHDEVLKMEYCLTTANLTLNETTTQTEKGDHALKLVSGRSWTRNKANAPGDTTKSYMNLSALSLLPIGVYSTEFKNGNTEATIWTTTQGSSTKTSAWYRIIMNSGVGVSRALGGKYVCRSVRCVRDEQQLKLGAAVVDSVACSFIETHIPVVQNIAITATAAAFTDSACTQAAGGVTTTISSAGDKIRVRFWNLEGNTKYYLRYTAKNLDLEDTVIISAATQCFCTVSRDLNQPADYKNYEWGSTTAGVTRVDSVSDHEGNRYGVVQIGSQCWTRENGRVLTSPTTGDSILKTDNISTYSAYKREARMMNLSLYRFDEIGALYNWCAIADYESGKNTVDVPAWYANRRGLCPEGWHMMTNDEWTILKTNASSKVQQLQGGPMLANPGDSAWTTDFVADTNRNRTGFSAPAACQWKPGSPYFYVIGHSHYSAVDQYNKTDNYYYCITPTSFGTTVNEAKSNGNSYRCLRDGDIKLGELVMDSISCTSAYFHTVVTRGTIDWTKTSHRCGFSDSSAFVSSTAASYTGTLTHSNDTIYGVIDNKLTCNKRYTFYIKVYGADQQSYGVQLSDSTRDLSLPISTSCVVSGALHTTAFSATDLSHEEGTDQTLTAVYDHQGNKYQVVQIGNQCWMRENMRATTSPSTDTTILLSTKYLSTQSKAAYYYNLDSANAKYGVLYNWCAAVDAFNTEEVATKKVTAGWAVTFTDARRGICPAGWHVPTNDEWIKMATEVGVGIGSGSNATRLAGGCDWTSSNTAGAPGNYTLEQRNSSFFTAVPAGRAYSNSSSVFAFDNINTYAYFWTSTPHTTTTANSYYCAMSNSNAYLSNGNTSRVSVYSVRCVRDEQLKLGAAVVDSVACTFIETHIPVVQNVAITATAAAFTDSACTQAAGGVTTTLSSAGDNVVARFWNLDGNTKYYLRYTVQNQNLEDTVIISAATQCFCTVSRALNQPADYKNYEWGSTTDGVTRVDSVSDHEGNRYGVVQIGSQCWTRENGRVQTSPTTGDTIITTSNTTNQYQREARWWNYDPSLDNAFIVYNWCAQTDYAMGAAATTIPAWYGNRQGLCPKGWHITTNDEWATVLKGSTSNADFFTYMISPKGNSKWVSYNNKAEVNMYGFTGLGCGEWNSADKFNDENALHLTTADQSTANNFKYIFFKYDCTYATGDNPLDHSHSYRCLRDGDVELGDMVMDAISCTEARFHAVVKKGNVDWSKTNVCGYSTNEDYIVDKTKTASITYSNDTIYGALTGLSCNTRYTFYIKVYDAAYQSYGVQLSDSTRDVQLEKETSCVVPDLRLSNHSSTDLSHEDGLGDVLTAVYDHQGNKYQVVQIGNQCWMRENMRATTSPRPDVITNFSKGESSQSSATIPYYYISTNVNSEAVNYEKFGCLYNWAAAMDTTVGNVKLGLTGIRRGICPEGWHIPADVEWYELEKQVANKPLTNEAARTDYSKSFDAGRLAGGCDWGPVGNSILKPQCYNHPDRNSTLFSALPAGIRNENGFKYVNTEADFWSSTEANATTVYRRLLHNGNDGISRADRSKSTYGFSVRCVRDVETTVAALQFSKVTCSSVSVATKMLTGIVTDTVNILVSTQINFSDTVDVKTFIIPTDSLLSTDFYDLKTNTTYYVKIADKTADFTTQLCACEVLQARDDNERATDGKVYEVKDNDGNWYGVVQIGNQCWLRENMRCTTSPKTGNRIIANYANTISKAATWYNNDSLNYAHYGLLYNLPAALDIQNGTEEVASKASTTTWTYVDTVYQGICPDGWHVPGDAEWTIMENYVVSDNHYGVTIEPNPVFGNRTDAIDNTTAANFEGKNTPISQMLADPRFWKVSTAADATGNTNSYRDTIQFGALPAGYYNSTTKSTVDQFTAFWSSTPNGTTNNSFGRQMYYNAPGVTRVNTAKSNRMSVRCVRDVETTVAALQFSKVTCSSVSVATKMLTGIVTDTVNILVSTQNNFSDTVAVKTLTIPTDSLLSTDFYDLKTNTTYYVKIADKTADFTTQLCACEVLQARADNEHATDGKVYEVKDNDGNWYGVVQIGNQCWLRENMRCTTSPKTGNRIIANYANTISKAATWYNNDSLNYAHYGLLYNLPAALDIQNDGAVEVATAAQTSTTWTYVDTVYQGICPDGWHVPGDAEWTIMENYVVSDNHYGVTIEPNPVFGNRTDAITNTTTTNFEGKNTPISQMLADPRFWKVSTTADATGNTNSYRDTIQFGALPAGFYYNTTPSLSAQDKYTAFWSSTPNGSTNSFGRQMYHNASGVTRMSTPKYNRMSVRCVRDVLVPKVALCGECTDESIQLKAVVNVDSCALLNSSKVFVASKLHPVVDSKFTGLQPGKYYVVSTSPTGHTATDSVTILTKVHTTCSGIAREGTEISTGVYADNEWSSATNVIDSVSDHQGNVYDVVQIGSFCWLKENMRTTQTNTGEALTNQTGTFKQKYY